MTDVLTLVFKTFMSRTDVKNDLRAAAPSPPCSSLVVGEQSISRSVLLLAAVTAASEMGVRVVFFTQTQIQSLPAVLQKCIPGLSPESLKKIKFCYPRTMEELLQQVASLHESPNLYPTPPSLIIVDRLEQFLCGPGGSKQNEFHPREPSCAAHLSALLCDTAAFLTNLLKEQTSGCASCRLIASFQSDVDTGHTSSKESVTDMILDVFDRYFQVRCTIEQDRSYEAAAAGLQELWHVYLSGTGSTDASSSTGHEGTPGVAQEWRLLIFPDSLMEFKLI